MVQATARKNDGTDIAYHLAYYSSSHIVNFIRENPVDWTDMELAGRNAPGDVYTPTPGVLEFLRLLSVKRCLFTQDEYLEFVFENPWKEYVEGMKIRRETFENTTFADKKMRGLAARLRTQFYVSMIDSIHVWAMLSESGLFDVCYMDSCDDACGKTDLTVVSGDRRIQIGLFIGSQNGRDCLKHKDSHRGGSVDCIRIELPMSRPKEMPGNKRWYTKNDLRIVLDAAR